MANNRQQRRAAASRSRRQPMIEDDQTDIVNGDDETEDRLSRDQESRDYEYLDDDYDDDWEEPELLTAPPARAGMVQRWVRTRVRGEEDAANAIKRMNQRWKPRSADTVPHGIYVPTIKHGDYAGCIGIEGMVLMERPEKLQSKVRQRNLEATRMQMRGVEEDLHRIHNPGEGLGRPEISVKSKVERRRPVIDDD